MPRLGRTKPNRPHLWGPASNAAIPTGTSNRTLGPFTSSAVGSQLGTGISAVTLAPFTSAAVGTHSPTTAKVQGTIWVKTLTGAGGVETFTTSAAVEAALVYAVLHGATNVDQLASATGTTDIADSPSVTTTQPNELVLWAHFRDAHLITVTPGTGSNLAPWTSSGNATRASVAANYQTQTVPGPSGTRRFAGDQADPWVAATISVIGAPDNITGTSNRTLAPFTSSASGTFTQNITGTSAQILDPFTGSGIGSTPVTATTPTVVGELTSFPRLRQGFSHPRWG